MITMADIQRTCKELLGYVPPTLTEVVLHQVLTELRVENPDGLLAWNEQLWRTQRGCTLAEAMELANAKCEAIICDNCQVTEYVCWPPPGGEYRGRQEPEEVMVELTGAKGETLHICHYCFVQNPGFKVLAD